jgi:hypothetical protein
MEYTSSDSLWKEADGRSGDVGSLECILVTGGSGLIGANVRDVLMGLKPNKGDGAQEGESSEYEIGRNEKWVFLSSKDGDLRLAVNLYLNAHLNIDVVI